MKNRKRIKLLGVSLLGLFVFVSFLSFLEFGINTAMEGGIKTFTGSLIILFSIIQGLLGGMIVHESFYRITEEE
jgi:hypothetical protein